MFSRRKECERTHSLLLVAIMVVQSILEEGLTTTHLKEASFLIGREVFV